MVTGDGCCREMRHQHVSTRCTKPMFTAGECLFTGGESLRTVKIIGQFVTAHSSIRHPSPQSVTS